MSDGEMGGASVRAGGAGGAGARLGQPPAAAQATVAVDIFGTTYQVRGEHDPQHLRQVASFLDQKMREVADQVATIDGSKIAILAALNIADELFQKHLGREAERENDDVIAAKIGALTRHLKQAVDG